MTFHTRLLEAPNPFFRIKKRFTRYLVIMACTGIISFLIALALLHADLSPFLSLALSAVISGFINYFMLELWGFPHRTGKLSAKRLVNSSLIGVIGFAARYGTLIAGLGLLQNIKPFDNVLALAIAYLVSFTIGYLVRSKVIFNKDASRRMHVNKKCDGSAGTSRNHRSIRSK